MSRLEPSRSLASEIFTLEASRDGSYARTCIFVSSPLKEFQVYSEPLIQTLLKILGTAYVYVLWRSAIFRLPDA